MTGPSAADLSGLLERLGRLAGDVGPVLSPSGPDDLVTAVAATAMRMFGAKACSVALLTDDDSELVFTTVVGAGAEGVRGLRLPSGQGIAGWVAMSGQPLVVSDLQRDPRWAGTAADSGHPSQHPRRAGGHVGAAARCARGAGPVRGPA